MRDPRSSPGPEERFSSEVARKAERRRRAQRAGNGSLWFSLGLFGVVGWSIAVPTLLGVALGIWMDARWPGRVSWTVTCLFAGVAIGCLNAWHWIKREGGGT